MIELKNVNKYYFKGTAREIHVINDVSLQFPSKGLVALYGRSGCGKTTLLNAIGGLDRFTGSITVDGVSIKKESNVIRNRKIGYVFQNYVLNPRVTVYENVADALRLCGVEQEEEQNSRVCAALRRVGMEKYLNRMPNTLSGGQKQRVAIARAIVKSPAIILADEPTGNLDKANTLMIMDLLRNIAEDHLVILVTHEKELVEQYCDQVVELSDGVVKNIRYNENVVKGTAYEEEKLPACKNRRYGRLFTWKSALREGFFRVMTSKKWSYKAMRIFLMIFTLMAMAVTTLYSIDYGKLLKIEEGCNHSTFYVLVPANEHLRPLYEAADKNAYGIDYVRRTNNASDTKVYLNGDIFSSFTYFRKFYLYENIHSLERSYNPIAAHAVLLPHSFASDHPVLYGRNTDLKQNEIVITRKMADIFLENSKYGYVNTYSDLIGLAITLQDTRVVGIVEHEEPEMYADIRGIEGDVGMQDYCMVNEKYRDAYLRVDNQEDLSEDEVIYLVEDISKAKFSVNEVIEVYGQTLKVKEVREIPGVTFEDYLKETYGVNGTIVSYEYNSYSLGWKVTWENPDTKKLQETTISGQEFAEYKTRHRQTLLLHPMTRYWMWVYCNRYQEDGMLLVHSRDVKATLEYLKEHYEDLYMQDRYQDYAYYRNNKSLFTPRDILEGELEKQTEKKNRSGFITVSILICLCICVYITMRGSMMGRIKEIGMYRCLGVTRRNLLFRFGVETFMLISCSVLPVFVIYLGLVKYVDASSVLDMTIYFPASIYLPLLVGMYAVGFIAGMLPIGRLLRKTPCEIMAKYDV